MCSDGAATTGELLDLLDRAAQLLRAAADLPLGAEVGDVELTGAVQRFEAIARMATGQKLAAVAELAEREAHRGQAARTAEDLLATSLHLSRREAKAQAELASGLRELPETAKALRDGYLGVSQAAVTVRKAEEVKGHDDAGRLLARIDTTAATAGQRLDRNRLARELDTTVARAGVDLLAERERRAFTRRSLSWTVRDGMHILHAELDPVGGSMVRAALDPLSVKTSDHDTRSFPQRQADALVQIAATAQTAGDTPKGALQSARVLLITTPDALHGTHGVEPAHLDGHGPVSTDTVRQLCCDATVQTVTMTPDGTALDATPDQRLPNNRQRAAVIARDRTCVGCGAPISQCQIHHITWWRHGGRTTTDNLVLVCWNCHHHIHHQEWVVTRDATGRYRAGPPGDPPHLDNSIEQQPEALTLVG